MPAIAAGRTSTTATSWARQITGSAPWRRWSGAVRLKAIPYRNAASRTSATPSAFEPSPTDGTLIATTPAKPSSSPAPWRRDGSWRTASAATRATISGVAALIIPASDESIHCWATANNTNGIAIQVTPTSAI